MAATTPRTVVVQIDGINFRIQALRGRRAFRGVRALQTCLGDRGYLMVTSPKFWAAEQDAQLTAIMQLESSTGASYDQGEQAMVELLIHSRGAGGQGVCYRTGEDGNGDPSAGWIPVTSMETLDRFSNVDHTTWLALRWEMIKLCYRPTSAAGGTSDDTPSAAMTSTPVSSPAGNPKPRQTGTPKAANPSSGISGG